MLNSCRNLSINGFYRTKLPEYLIYIKHQVYGTNIRETCVSMFSTKNPSESAVMFCNPEVIYRKDKGWVNSLYISYLTVLKSKGKGLGTNLLNFAKIYSEKLGCEGRFHLYASSSGPAKYIPHIFYRKFGMNTGFIDIDKTLDMFIKQRKKATAQDFKTLEMFYPPVVYSEKQRKSLLSIIKNFYLYRIKRP